MRKLRISTFLALVGAISGLDILYSENNGSPYCANFSTFTTDLDHFSFDDRKIDIRVITDDRFYESGGPVLFYTGNEGAIELFCENTGFQRLDSNFISKNSKKLNSQISITLSESSSKISRKMRSRDLRFFATFNFTI